MQFWSHCYTVVTYQTFFRLSVYKIQPYTSRVQNFSVLARYTIFVPRLMSQSWFCNAVAYMSAINAHLLHFIPNADINPWFCCFGSALLLFSVNMGLGTVTGAIAPVIIIVYTNRSVDTNGCYNAHNNKLICLFVCLLGLILYVPLIIFQL